MLRGERETGRGREEGKISPCVSNNKEKRKRREEEGRCRNDSVWI